MIRKLERGLTLGAVVAGVLGYIGIARGWAEGSIVDYAQLGNAIETEGAAALRSVWPQMLAVFGVVFGVLLLAKVVFHVTKG